MVEYSVVIPVYNNATCIDELHSRLVKVFATTSGSFEVIFVDDGSRDGSWKKLQEVYSNNEKVKIIQLMRNFGQHNALMCGFHFAEGEYIITLDADLQNPPEEIPKLINKIKKGYDFVYGNYRKKEHSWWRNAGSFLVQLMYRKVFNFNHNLTAFRIIRKDIIRRILKYNKEYVFIDGLLAQISRKVGTCLVEHRKSTGKSGYNMGKLIRLAFNMLSNFSIFPLQIASIIGILFAGMAFIMSIFFFVKKILFGVPVKGYTSLIIIISLFSGIQLIALGIIGEYIGRVHSNIGLSPQYEIREYKVDEGKKAD